MLHVFFLSYIKNENVLHLMKIQQAILTILGYSKYFFYLLSSLLTGDGFLHGFVEKLLDFSAESLKFNPTWVINILPLDKVLYTHKV